jgi:hypothetical protein
MTLFRNASLILAILLSPTSFATEDISGAAWDDKTQDDIVIVHENSITGQDAHHFNLRRELQREDLICLTNKPAATVDGNCEEQPDYPCTCQGNLRGQLMCSYCTGFKTARHKELCLQTGSSTTYYDRDDGVVKTCHCNYNADIFPGKVELNCHIQAPPPEPTEAPTPDTRSFESDGCGPFIDIGLVPIPTPDLDQCIPTRGFGYHPIVCLDDIMPIGYSCDGYGMICSEHQPDYPCSCQVRGVGASCSYCQVRTPNAVVCLPVGDKIKFTPVCNEDVEYQTECTCEATVNGEVYKSCNSVAQ